MMRSLLILVCLFMGIQSFGAPAKSSKKKKAESYQALPDKDVQVQPTETVEAQPLEKPISAQMRMRRQQMEMETEEQIVQELENARLADEKARREQLFGGRIRPVSEPAPAPAVPAPVASQQVVTSLDVENEPSDTTYYVGAVGGVLNYPSVENIDGANFATGVAVGAEVAKSFFLEGNFVYSFQQAEINRVVSVDTEDIDQIGLGAKLSYHWTLARASWFTPITGVILSYTRRDYNGGDNSSNAFDAGLNLGGDFAVNDQVSLGFEYRFMTNIDYERENGPSSADVALQQLATGRTVENLENFDYQLFLLTAKLKF